MLIIEYHRDGKAYGDHEAEGAVKKYYQESIDRPHTEITMVTSTHMIINFALLLVAEGVIPHTDLVIRVDGKDSMPDKRGQIEAGTPGLQLHAKLMQRTSQAWATQDDRPRQAALGV